MAKSTTGVRLFQLILPYKGWIVLSVLCMVGFNFFTATPAFFAKNIVDALAYGKAPELYRYFLVGAGIVVIYFLKGLCFFGQNFLMGRMIQQFVAELRQRLFDHLLRLPLGFYSRSQTGDLISRFTNDTQVLQSTLTVGVTGPFRDIPQMFLVLGIMVYRSWQLSLLTLILIPVTLFFIQRFGRNNKKAVSHRQISFGGLTTLLVETISGIRVVKAFGMEEYESKRFAEANDLLLKRNMKTVLITSYSTPVIEILGAIAGATMIGYGGYLIIQGSITAGDFASFFMSFFLLNEPVKQLNGFNLKLQEGIAAVRRVFEVLDTTNDIQEAPNPVKIPHFQEGIHIQIQRFSYPRSEKAVLQNIDLKLQKGEVVALVGSSGSGKTTLANLIPRFYDVTEGSITIDGHDLRQLELASLRSLISIVTQETILFNDTILNNITYGHPECPKPQMIVAAKAANAHEFIMRLSKDYDTPIGEKGVLLSGGQRQRLSIARALVKDSPILILDEATSALDSESEIEVQQALDHLMKNRTTLVIAHRLSTIRNAHRICVLEEGQIVETGTHEELLKSGGRYQQLYAMQFFRTEKSESGD